MIHPAKLGMVIAAVIAGWHVVWSVLVLTGVAQPVIDFVFWAHMIRPVYVVKPFDPVAAFALIAITFFFGYVVGYGGGTVWNKVHRA